MISRCKVLELFAGAAWFVLAVSLDAAPLATTIQPPATAAMDYFKFGATNNPAGHEVAANSRNLLLDGQSWFPVMGEIHYARVPQAGWREELLKIKAGCGYSGDVCFLDPS